MLPPSDQAASLERLRTALAEDYGQRIGAMEGQISALRSSLRQAEDEREYLVGKVENEVRRRETAESALADLRKSATITETTVTTATEEELAIMTRSALEVRVTQMEAAATDARTQLRLREGEVDRLRALLEREAELRAVLETENGMMRKRVEAQREEASHGALVRIRELERSESRAKEILARVRSDLDHEHRETERLEAAAVEERSARLRAEAEVRRLVNAAVTTDASAEERVERLTAAVADLRGEHEAVLAEQQKKLRSLRSQLAFAHDEIRTLDAKLSREVAARATAESERDAANGGWTAGA